MSPLMQLWCIIDNIAWFILTDSREFTVTNYRIASNYSPGVYFFPAIFNQATKRDRQLLLEETRAVYDL